jgi:hypothetical protein
MALLSSATPRRLSCKPSYPRIAFTAVALVAAATVSACGAAPDTYDREAGPYYDAADGGDADDASDAQVDSAADGGHSPVPSDAATKSD